MKTMTGSPAAYFDAAAGLEQAGQEISLCACVHRIRQMSRFAFVVLRTGRHLVQSVWSEECRGDFAQLAEGAFLRCTGKVVEQPRAPLGYELQLTSFQVMSTPAEEYPLKVSQKKLGCSLEVNLDHRSVALRNPLEKAAFFVTQEVVEGFRQFMRDQHFTEIHTPKIVSAGAEGGANIFSLDYFHKPAYLAQSPQFYKQTCTAIFDRVYEVGTVFRAERHNTSRHLNEYVGLDFEMGYITGMEDVMEMETAMLRSLVDHLAATCGPELELLEATLPTVGEIPAVTFQQAMEVLGYQRPKGDLDPDDEVRLCKWAQEAHGSEFVFVTHYPTAKRPFYAMDDPENPQCALSFDLLFRGLEVTTGGQRIHDYHMQLEKLGRYGIEPQDLGSYLDAHKHGLPPHGGLGIGLERLVMKLLGLQNIRRASLFPRDVNRLDP